MNDDQLDMILTSYDLGYVLEYLEVDPLKVLQVLEDLGIVDLLDLEDLM